jgi:hypothetical protein
MPMLSGADLILAPRAEANEQGRASSLNALLTVGSAQAASQLHVDVLLLKPVEPDQLEHVICSLLGP